MDNYENIRADAQRAQVTPPKGAWDRIEDKLDNRKNLAMNAKRKFVRQLVSVGATFVLALTFAYIYQENNKHPEYSKGNIASWEELDNDKVQHFDHNKVQLLYTAYQSIDNTTLLKRASW